MQRLAWWCVAAVFSAGVVWGAGAEYRKVEASGKGSVVASFTLKVGAEERGRRWVELAAVKENGEQYTLWMWSEGEPARGNVKRYLFGEGRSSLPREYRDGRTGEAVLPGHGGWEQLRLPVMGLPEEVWYLGHRYRRGAVDGSATAREPGEFAVVELRPDVWIGQASNTRQKEETRRYDGSDYELVRLTREDYRAMREAGITVARVDEKQWEWADELGLYYWGDLGGAAYPEMLYRSNYIGPALFLDEPAVGTRDHVVRPRLAKDEVYRKALTPQLLFAEFQSYFEHGMKEGAPWRLMKSLRARADVDVGEMSFAQRNLYTWETMVSTAAYQLTRDERVPEAIVFEPPGRVGTRRTLPEMDMTYGVQLPPDDPKSLTSVLYGFLRGAARVAGKQWGVSIYGGVDQTDSPFWLTHAYDLGATRFFFWDNYQYACVPFGEVLTLARHLREHARSHPRGDVARLRRAAATAVLLPVGYDLGHVQMGKGNLWGIHELNLERVNRRGVTHRAVMSAFFAEVERLFRAGAVFDLLWDVPGLKLEGYKTVVRVREDGVVENGGGAPVRAVGPGPGLEVSVEAKPEGEALRVTARGRVRETEHPVFYTYGADTEGVYRNAMVAWEVYGPEEEDQVVLLPEKLKPRVVEEKGGGMAEVAFVLKREGSYRLRATTVDAVGRSTVVWKEMVVERGTDGRLVGRKGFE